MLYHHPCIAINKSTWLDLLWQLPGTFNSTPLPTSSPLFQTSFVSKLLLLVEIPKTPQTYSNLKKRIPSNKVNIMSHSVHWFRRTHLHWYLFQQLLNYLPYYSVLLRVFSISFHIPFQRIYSIEVLAYFYIFPTNQWFLILITQPNWNPPENIMPLFSCT